MNCFYIYLVFSFNKHFIRQLRQSFIYSPCAVVWWCGLLTEKRRSSTFYLLAVSPLGLLGQARNIQDDQQSSSQLTKTQARFNLCVICCLMCLIISVPGEQGVLEDTTQSSVTSSPHRPRTTETNNALNFEACKLGMQC